MVDVPDERVDRLTEMFKPKRTIYAQVTYNDIAGFGKGRVRLASVVHCSTPLPPTMP